jgi:hypothetical protein
MAWPYFHVAASEGAAGSLRHATNGMCVCVCGTISLLPSRIYVEEDGRREIEKASEQSTEENMCT